jgi:large subunit ribosomal protein L4
LGVEMISVPIRNMAGAETGVYEFDAADVAADVNKQLLHDVVVMYEANRRVGTVQTRSRGMVTGSTRKLFRQKGTGRARAGNARTPVRRGGGHAFGKKNRDYSYRMPKKAVRLATRMALLSKFQDEQAIVLSGWDVEAPKTKVVVQALKSLGVNGSVLIATDGVDGNVWKSARNIAGVQVLPIADVNAHVLLRHRQLVVVASAMDSVLGRGAAATA